MLWLLCFLSILGFEMHRGLTGAWGGFPSHPKGLVASHSPSLNPPGGGGGVGGLCDRTVPAGSEELCCCS